MERQIVAGGVLVVTQLQSYAPDVGGVGSGPGERNRFVEPEAMILQPPEARQRSQEKDNQFG